MRHGACDVCVVILDTERLKQKGEEDNESEC